MSKIGEEMIQGLNEAIEKTREYFFMLNIIESGYYDIARRWIIFDSIKDIEAKKLLIAAEEQYRREKK